MSIFSKTPLDPWHYPRPQLADAYLREFEVGLQSAKGVFAKRRTGKTGFLNKDLLSAARKKQYLSSYANLREDRESPARTIVVALASAIEAKSHPGQERARRCVQNRSDVPGLRVVGVPPDVVDSLKPCQGQP